MSKRLPRGENGASTAGIKNVAGNKSMKHTKSAGGVVINPKKEILVINQKGISWSLPKGHINESEDELSAAKREIKEESGIAELELIKDLGSYQRISLDDKSEVKTIYMFLFKTNQIELKPIDSENPEAKWVDKEEVASLLTHPKDKEFFLRIKKEI